MFDWLDESHREACGKRSHRRMILSAAFAFAAGLCIAGLFVEISKPVEAIAIFLVTSAFGLNGFGRFAEAMEKRGQP
jgi:hypothetical protein